MGRVFICVKEKFYVLKLPWGMPLRLSAVASDSRRARQQTVGIRVESARRKKDRALFAFLQDGFLDVFEELKERLVLNSDRANQL